MFAPFATKRFANALSFRQPLQTYGQFASFILTLRLKLIAFAQFQMHTVQRSSEHLQSLDLHFSPIFFLFFVSLMNRILMLCAS